MGCKFTIETKYIHGQYAQLLSTKQIALVFLPNIGGRIVYLHIGKQQNVFYPNIHYIREPILVDERFPNPSKEKQIDIDELTWGGYFISVRSSSNKAEEKHQRTIPTFDFGNYSMQVFKDSIQMKSPLDTKTKLQLIKNIYIVSDNELHFTITICNHSKFTQTVHLFEQQQLRSNIYTVLSKPLEEISKLIDIDKQSRGQKKKQELFHNQALNYNDNWTSIFHKADFTYKIPITDFTKNRYFTVHPMLLSKKAIAWERKYKGTISSFVLESIKKLNHLKISSDLGEYAIHKKKAYRFRFAWKFTQLRRIGKNKKATHLAKLIKPRFLLWP